MTSPTEWADSISDALIELRQYAEARMKDTCVVEYKTGNKVRDPETRTEVDEYATRFESKCRIKDMGFADADQAVAGRREAVGATQIHMPWNVARVFTGDRITITAVGPTTAPRHLGKTFYVGTDHDASDNTATRLNVREAP